MSEPDQRLCLYGIKACDTMKKARTWLDEHGQNYEFHDYKSAGIDRAHLEAWCNEHGWQTVLNRAGTTFRKLPEADQKAFFRLLYALLVDDERGPRLPTLFLALGSAKVRELLGGVPPA